MRHSKWLILLSFLSIAWIQGCSCEDGGQIRNAQGDGRVVEVGPNNTRNEVEETTVDWGAVLVNTKVERKVILRNTGMGAMEITDIVKSDPFAAEFTFDDSDFTLDPQEEIEFSIFFNPKAEGTYQGTLTVVLADASNSQLVLHLAGRAVQGGCVITPADTADFGAVALGTSYVKAIKISNASEIAWTVNVGAIASDTDSGAFAFSDGFVPGVVSVPAHGELLIPIEFKPNHIGMHHAILSLADQPMCQPSVLPLQGNGVEDVLECEPKVQVTDPNTGAKKWACALNFGFVDPNTKAVSAVTFKNLGNTPLTISGLELIQDSKGDVFDVVEKNTVDYPIPPASSVKIPMSFLPTLLGQYNGKLKYISDDPSRPSGEVLLLGTGGGPAISVQPGAVDFGPVATGTFQRRRLTITNVGTDAPGTTDDNLRLMSPDDSTTCSATADCGSGQVCQMGKCWAEKQAILETSFPGEFTLEWPPEGYIAQGIAAGQSADLLVKFTPTSLGVKTATVKIYSNDPGKPEVVVTVTADARSMPPCEYDVIPSALNFGNVENGKYMTLSFFLKNTSADPANECLVSTLGFARNTPQAFTLVNGALAGQIVKGGESLEVPVRFAPKADGTYSGAVEFYISSVSKPQGAVQLSASSQPGCLMVAPNALDFGVIQKNCNSRDRNFTIYNVCSQDQTIQSIDVQQGLSQEFKVVQKPQLPYSLPSGSSVDFKVRYSPVDETTDQGSVAIKTAQLPQPYVIPLSGRGALTAIQTDIFAQDPQPKVDVLFVIDDSGSMADKQASLGSNFAAFIQFAITQQVDYQIAVTTTGVDAAHGGVYTDNNDRNGCFYPDTGGNPKIITTQTPNVAQVFQQNVKVGTDGNASELLIRPAYLALTNPNITTCNAGFLRDDANLAVVLVSDAADQDTVPVMFYLNAFFNIKGFKRQNMFSFSAINPKSDPASCQQDSTAMANARVEQVVIATAGVTDDICTPNWSTTLEKLGQTAFGYRTRFFLSNTPDITPPNKIEVQIDGVDYADIGPFGDVRWSYDSGAQAIDFSVLAVPEPGSTITVSYHVACL